MEAKTERHRETERKYNWNGFMVNNLRPSFPARCVTYSKSLDLSESQF